MDLMLAVTLTTAAAALIGLFGVTLIVMTVLHAYASWTLRDIDRDSEL